jgi:hypothetical protein
VLCHRLAAQEHRVHAAFEAYYHCEIADKAAAGPHVGWQVKMGLGAATAFTSFRNSRRGSGTAQQPAERLVAEYWNVIGC